MTKNAPRSSCGRCNAVLPASSFESDWRFARCAKCGARSPVPESVRAMRPVAFDGGAARALADVMAMRPADVVVAAGVAGATLTLHARRKRSFGAWLRAAKGWAALLERQNREAQSELQSGRVERVREWDEAMREHRRIFATWEVTIEAHPEDGRWRLETSDTARTRGVLDAPFVGLSRDDTPAADADAPAPVAGGLVILRGGYPVHEEWVAASVRTEDAAWVAEWVAAELRAHVVRVEAPDPRKNPRSYRD